jgi:uncharacterized membrane protein
MRFRHSGARALNTLANTFLKGLLTFLPMIVTAWLVYAVGTWLNRVTWQFVHWLAPGLPSLPGLGIGLAVLAIFALGVLVSSRLTRWLYYVLETPLRHLPAVRELYAALQQLTALLAPGDQHAAGQAVVIRHPDLALSLVGFQTRTDAECLVGAVQDPDTVAVYLPMSYQIGGYTVFVPRAWVTPLALNVETAMRNTLTGWVQREPGRSGAKA